MEFYIGGCSGIKNPVDAKGKQITEGCKLTWDFHDSHYQKGGVKDWMREPVFEVKRHKSGEGLCAVGINKDFYLHDFRFKYCEVI